MGAIRSNAEKMISFTKVLHIGLKWKPSPSFPSNQLLQIMWEKKPHLLTTQELWENVQARQESLAANNEPLSRPIVSKTHMKHILRDMKVLHKITTKPQQKKGFVFLPIQEPLWGARAESAPKPKGETTRQKNNVAQQ
eukprot:c13475_g1_i1.p1 GENE.c13475_g1_i1~~c13475_g1_i1.p1  ORF type:complete len:138 (-),score=27.87 c13475_g1_i1:11-424(-)